MGFSTSKNHIQMCEQQTQVEHQALVTTVPRLDC